MAGPVEVGPGVAAACSSRRFALWGYNGSSERAFAQARQVGRPCILDRTIGDYRVYNRIMAEVAEAYADWFVATERAEPQAQIGRDEREYALADRILVGSPFADRTLRSTRPECSCSGQPVSARPGFWMRGTATVRESPDFPAIAVTPSSARSSSTPTVIAAPI